MSNIKKAASNKWIIILALILACYSFAAVYEGVETTPIDDFTGMMSAVAESESFAEQYQGETFGMDLEGYKSSLDSMGILKSRYLQGPLNFLSCFLFFVISVALVHIFSRMEEALRKSEEKTRLAESIDVCMPSLLVMAAKYILFALYARATGELVEYNLALSAVSAAAVSCVPFLLALVHRRKNGRPVVGVTFGMLITAAANVAFQLI